jgi:hypothetical protein
MENADKQLKRQKILCQAFFQAAARPLPQPGIEYHPDKTITDEESAPLAMDSLGHYR